MAATCLIQSPSSTVMSCLGPGLRTHRITKRPIMHMMRSARVKIHSGHSSHSTSLHLQADFDIRFSPRRSRRTRRKRRVGLEDSAGDAVYETSDVEVDQEADAVVAE